jgi:L-amino acid N-acyltransferase YncA
MNRTNIKGHVQMKTRRMLKSDWAAVSRIYTEGIQTGIATFESSPPAAWNEWISKRLRECCIVCEDAGEILGWGALSPVSARYVYRGVVEVSVYVAEAHRGKHVGHILMDELIVMSERDGIWTLQAQMFPENTRSIELHKKHGFRKVGVRLRIGKMTHGPFQGKWRDNVLMERRSKVVGI